MDLTALNLFVEVIQQGSFAAVARKRGISPSSVSRAIATLEEELGIRLFQRSTRNLEPSEAGIVYYDSIKPLITKLDHAKQMATDISGEPKGTLRVTAAPVYANSAIVPLLPALSKTYPQLSIELLLTDTYLDLVEERIDVAIRLGTLQNSSYIAKRLRSMSFHICASKDYVKAFGTPQIPTDLLQHRCLLFPRTGYTLDWLFKDKNNSITKIAIHGNYTITNSQAIKQCAIHSMGLALLPDWLIKDDIMSGKLVKILTEFEVTATDYQSAIWLLYPSREHLPLKSRVFMDFLMEHM